MKCCFCEGMDSRELYVFDRLNGLLGFGMFINKEGELELLHWIRLHQPLRFKGCFSWKRLDVLLRKLENCIWVFLHFPLNFEFFMRNFMGRFGDRESEHFLRVVFHTPFLFELFRNLSFFIFHRERKLIRRIFCHFPLIFESRMIIKLNIVCRLRERKLLNRIILHFPTIFEFMR